MNFLNINCTVEGLVFVKIICFNYFYFILEDTMVRSEEVQLLQYTHQMTTLIPFCQPFYYTLPTSYPETQPNARHHFFIRKTKILEESYA